MEIIDLLPMKRQGVKSAANTHEGKSNDSSIKERKLESTLGTDEPESDPAEEKVVIKLLPVKE